MHYLRFFTFAFLLSAAHADELTLELKPFSVTHSFNGSVLPKDFSSLRLDAEAWAVFKVATISEHGSKVTEGDVLVSFETKEIDQKIDDTKSQLESLEQKISTAQIELKSLEELAPEELVRAERAAASAAEELAYFTATQRKISEQDAEQDVNRREQILESYEEELKQLLQMYEADDLTEDTEEIILKQQRDKITSAKFSLMLERLKAERMIKVYLPRKELSLNDAVLDSALKLKAAEKEIPLNLERKRLELKVMKASLKSQYETLANLEKDRALFEIKAPSDGIFYYGSVENGKWLVSDLAKALVPAGNVPVEKNFGTFVPSTSTFSIYAFLGQKDALALTGEIRGFATLSGLEDELFLVELLKLAEVPDTNRTYGAVFDAAFPKDIKPTMGQTVKIRVISYSAEKAITVPVSALLFNEKGWTVEVKLADGKNEQRVVSRGKSSGKEVEITAGLEPGQVIIVP